MIAAGRIIPVDVHKDKLVRMGEFRRFASGLMSLGVERGLQPPDKASEDMTESKRCDSLFRS